MGKRSITSRTRKNFLWRLFPPHNREQDANGACKILNMESNHVGRIQPSMHGDVKTAFSTLDKTHIHEERNWWQEIHYDFTKGDKKILRAIGRTALVNAVVGLTAVTCGAATGIAGFATGGAITAKRLGDGLNEENPKEVAKSLAVFGCATTASITGQALAGFLMIAIAGASLPLAAAVAFGVGCTSGIAAGALSEWGVDRVWRDCEDWLGELSKLIEAVLVADGSRQSLLGGLINMLSGHHSLKLNKNSLQQKVERARMKDRTKSHKLDNNSASDRRAKDNNTSLLSQQRVLSLATVVSELEGEEGEEGGGMNSGRNSNSSSNSAECNSNIEENVVEYPSSDDDDGDDDSIDSYYDNEGISVGLDDDDVVATVQAHIRGYLVRRRLISAVSQ